MTRRQESTLTLPCPDCGSPLQFVRDAINEPVITPLGRIERRTRPAAFVACTGCEYCAEVK